MTALRVGLNLFFLHPQCGGTGTYSRELLAGLLRVEPETSVTAFVSHEVPAELVERDWGGDVRWVVLRGEVTSGGPGNGAVAMWSQWGRLPAQARRRGLDVVHGLANVAPLTGPQANVVTLLDLIWLHDEASMAFRDRLGMRVLALTSVRRADRVITISAAGRDDLVATVGTDGARIDPILLGTRPVAAARVSPEEELRERFELGDAPVVLCVAQKRSHKNLAALVRALAVLDDPRAVLVLPGGHTAHEDELRALAAELGVRDRVRFLGWVDDAELEGLYALASVFALPSFHEGFGLPVVEAMQRGVPVVCANASALPEVAGDAALLFDPHDPRDVARALDAVLRDPELRAGLVARGRRRCEELTWDATARATLGTYRRAIAERAARR